MGTYRELPPPPSLALLVRCLWVHEPGAGDAAFDVLPDGCLDIVVRGERASVAGPDTEPVAAALVPGETIVGLRFHPGAAPAGLGTGADTLRDAHVDLEDLWGPAAARELAERAQAGPQALAAAAHARLVAGTRALDASALRAAALLERRPGTDVATLAGAVGFSERQLRRRFAAAVGYGPKTFARIARFQRLLRGLGTGEPLAGLAAATGYADQAHMTHEAVALGGRTPAQLRSRFARTSDFDKTPAAGGASLRA